MRTSEKGYCIQVEVHKHFITPENVLWQVKQAVAYWAVEKIRMVGWVIIDSGLNNQMNTSVPDARGTL